MSEWLKTSSMVRNMVRDERSSFIHETTSNIRGARNAHADDDDVAINRFERSRSAGQSDTQVVKTFLCTHEVAIHMDMIQKMWPVFGWHQLYHYSECILYNVFGRSRT